MNIPSVPNKIQKTAYLDNGRAMYAALQSAYPKVQVISDSYLRMETPLNNNSSTYSFTPNASNSGQDILPELKLNQNDVFGCLRYSLTIGQRTVANPGYTQLQTFPCVALSGTGVTVANLYAIYNSYLTIKIGQTTFYDALPVLPCLFIPITQQDTVNAVSPYSATAAATPGAITGFTVAGQPYANQRNMDSSWRKMNAQLVLSGQAQNSIILNVPTPVSGVQLTTTTTLINVLCLMFEGFIAKNAVFNGGAMQS